MVIKNKFIAARKNVRDLIKADVFFFAVRRFFHSVELKFNGLFEYFLFVYFFFLHLFRFLYFLSVQTSDIHTQKTQHTSINVMFNI